jgi:release factor glutamine methyltransferase
LSDPAGIAPVTIRQAVLEARDRLRAAGVPDADLDARLLVAAALGLPGSGGLMARGDDPFPPQAQERLGDHLRRRAEAREPVARILGRRGFWTLELALGPDTLEPRPDTETLVSALLERLPDRSAPRHVLDLGTGTGAILLALLSEWPAARGLGLDVAPGAVAVAQDNAARCGLADRAEMRQGDWRSGLPDLEDGSFDVVASNPPYVRADEMATLAPEVRDHDPPAALVAGADGLAAYRALVPLAHRLLAPGGWLALEIGHTQAEAVSSIIEQDDFSQPEVVPDLGRRPRCVIARRPGFDFQP